jgi:hypothetical protein
MGELFQEVALEQPGRLILIGNITVFHDVTGANLF